MEPSIFSHMISHGQKAYCVSLKQSRLVKMVVMDQTWAFNMHLYLENMDLFEHAEGLPPSESGAALLRTFNSHAKKTWTYICMAVEPEQQIHVRDMKTTKEAWDALRSQFACESILQKV